jgi:hypothetical protein
VESSQGFGAKDLVRKVVPRCPGTFGFYVTSFWVLFSDSNLVCEHENDLQRMYVAGHTLEAY